MLTAIRTRCPIRRQHWGRLDAGKGGKGKKGKKKK